MHKLPNGVLIPNVEALKDAIKDGNTGYAILLGGGVAFSRKTIKLKGKMFRIKNHIDDSIQLLTEKQLLNSDYTHIGEAMKKGALVVRD